MQAWRSILDSTDEKAKSHISLSDTYKNDLYENIKECRIKKENNLKKVSFCLFVLKVYVFMQFEGKFSLFKIFL